MGGWGKVAANTSPCDGPPEMTPILPSRPNAYTGSPLDRAGHRRSDAGWIATQLADPATRFVPLWRGRTLVREADGGTPEAVFPQALASEPYPWAFLGTAGEVATFAVDFSAVEDPAPLVPAASGAFAELRGASAALPAQQAAIVAHARALLHWRSRHRFCGICGAACEPRQAGHVMVCSGCATHHFPRTDPAVIMLVSNGERVLLGRSQRFANSKMYSTLAGFVEPGESLEEAVAREVFEESAVRVGQVRYHSSQPWPFPGNIMLGFYAEALSETIRIDETELVDARWFSRAEMADPAAHGFLLPPGDSIARRLIEDWLAA